MPKQMKSLVIITGCLVAISLVSGVSWRKELRENIEEVERLHKSGNQRDAILKLADLSYEGRILRVSDAYYLAGVGLLEDLTKIIGWRTPNIYLDEFNSLRRAIDRNLFISLARWRIEIAGDYEQKSYLEFADFVVRHHAPLIDQLDGNALAVRDALYDNKYLCSIFNYPLYDGSSPEAKFAKLIHLCGQSDREGRSIIQNQDEDLSAIMKLKSACSTKFNQEEFLPALESAIYQSRESNQIATTDINPTTNFSNKRDVCTKLLHENLSNLSRRHKNRTLFSLFDNECLEDIVERFSQTLNVSEKYKYRAALILRWLMRLGQYVKQNDGNDNFATADGYLRRLVREVPAQEAELAYNEGTGLCNIVNDEEFRLIWEQFKFVENLRVVFGQESSQESKIDVGRLIQFGYLRAVCSFRRSLYERSFPQSKKRKISSRQQSGSRLKKRAHMA